MKKILFFYLLFFSFYLPGEPQKLLEVAKANYQKGIHAKNWQERFASLNEALTQYSQIEKDFGPSLELNQAMADLFFELTEYPWSILYYERVLYEAPNDEVVRSRLQAAQNRLGQEASSKPPSSYLSLILFESFISQSFRLQMFFFASLLSLLIGSLYIWNPNFFLKISLVTTTLFSVLILISYLLAFYFSPIEGMSVLATGLYREPNQQASQLTSQPILAGIKVRVIETTDDGYWLKIIDSEGRLGYVPSAAFRII